MNAIATYAQRIGDALGNHDPATVALIEAIMRGEHGTLDHLGGERFTYAARRALADAVSYAFAGELTMVCEAYELAVPTLRV